MHAKLYHLQAERDYTIEFWGEFYDVTGLTGVNLTSQRTTDTFTSRKNIHIKWTNWWYKNPTREMFKQYLGSWEAFRSHFNLTVIFLAICVRYFQLQTQILPKQLVMFGFWLFWFRPIIKNNFVLKMDRATIHMRGHQTTLSLISWDPSRLHKC